MQASHPMSGVFTPVVTPFQPDLSVDDRRFSSFCRWLVAQGAGLAVFGTNSEANSLSLGERNELLDRLIEAGIPGAKVKIRDLAGDGDHFAAEVVAEAFRGKTRVQQHQMVYDALQGNMGGVLHALALQTSVPE